MLSCVKAWLLSWPFTLSLDEVYFWGYYNLAFQFLLLKSGLHLVVWPTVYNSSLEIFFK